MWVVDNEEQWDQDTERMPTEHEEAEIRGGCGSKSDCRQRTGRQKVVGACDMEMGN